MISGKQHDVVADAAGLRRAKQAGLSEFDGQSLAVVLHRGQTRIVLRGRAAFVRDDAVGDSLQILMDDDEPGQPVLILSENEWNGRIIPDFHHGCDFCLVIDCVPS